MNSIIFLMKNMTTLTTTKFEKDLAKYFNKIDFILFPIDNENTAFVIHQPKKYMLNFSKAVVKFQIAVIQYSHFEIDTSNYPSLMHPITKTIHSIPELIQYLHSLNRIRYTNKLSNSNESYLYEIIEFTEFRIDIYNKKNEVIYNKKMDLNTEMGQFGVAEILKRIDKIYFPWEFKTSDMFKELYLYITDDKWDIAFNLERKGLYGVFLLYTSSVSFFHAEDIFMMNTNLHSLYAYTLTHNPNEVSYEDLDILLKDVTPELIVNEASDRFTSPVRYQDFWVHEPSYIIEFILFLSYTYSNIILMAEINDFGNIKNTYTCKSEITLELMSISGSERYQEIGSSAKSPFTIKELFNILYHKR